MFKVYCLTGEELRRNEDARLEMQQMHEMVAVLAASGNVAQTLESAKKKLKIMKTIKQEMMLEVKDNLLIEIQDLQQMSFLRSKLVFFYNYDKKCKKIARI